MERSLQAPKQPPGGGSEFNLTNKSGTSGWSCLMQLQASVPPSAGEQQQQQRGPALFQHWPEDEGHTPKVRDFYLSTSDFWSL